MGNYFSHSKGGKKAKNGHITDIDRAILSLKTQRRKLEDQSTMIEQRIEHNLKVARELIAAAKKDRALLALKKKKMNEQQLQSLQAWLINVEDILNNMELRQQQNRVFNALKDGNTAMKALQKEFTLEDVERLKEDSAEAQAYQEEINAALVGALTDLDTEAVEQELDALEAEAAAAEVADLPAAPTTEVQVETPVADMEPAAEGPAGTVAAAEGPAGTVAAAEGPAGTVAAAEGPAGTVAAAEEVGGVEALREAARERGKPLVAEEPMLAA